MKDFGDLPGQIDRIADAGIHSLPASGAVDVPGVAGDEHSAAAEALRDPMVDLVRGEPVDFADVDTEQVLDMGAKILEIDVWLQFQFRRYDSDQALGSGRADRDHQAEAGLADAEINSSTLYSTDRGVGDVEQAL